jgi:hypothetical protein
MCGCCAGSATRWLRSATDPPPPPSPPPPPPPPPPPTAGLADLDDDPGCTIRTIDLETGDPWDLGGDFAGIVVANYLHRPLFPALVASLSVGGIVIYETFAAGNGRFGKPSSPDFLLRPGELLQAFGALTILAFEQGAVDEPRQAVVQRIAAVKGVAPDRLTLP